MTAGIGVVCGRQVVEMLCENYLVEYQVARAETMECLLKAPERTMTEP